MGSEAGAGSWVASNLPAPGGDAAARHPDVPSHTWASKRLAGTGAGPQPRDQTGTVRPTPFGNGAWTSAFGRRASILPTVRAGPHVSRCSPVIALFFVRATSRAGCPEVVDGRLGPRSLGPGMSRSSALWCGWLLRGTRPCEGPPEPGFCPEGRLRAREESQDSVIDVPKREGG